MAPDPWFSTYDSTCQIAQEIAEKIQQRNQYERKGEKSPKLTVTIRTLLQNLKEKIALLKDLLLRAVSTHQITQLEGDRRQNLLDDLVTRERLLLASFKNEGAEPDLIRYYDSPALKGQDPGIRKLPWVTSCNHLGTDVETGLETIAVERVGFKKNTQGVVEVFKLGNDRDFCFRKRILEAEREMIRMKMTGKREASQKYRGRLWSSLMSEEAKRGAPNPWFFEEPEETRGLGFDEIRQQQQKIIQALSALCLRIPAEQAAAASPSVAPGSNDVFIGQEQRSGLEFDKSRQI
ncbi:Syntaxin-8 [Tupaia chinensis]|uniref:Syntaxin-8 n=1 Tax=Tupaia chinensis TaxID=246437 RepID=L9JS73_TUPCH|nr:Syntaxin-8 [Tupaia chinensis]